MCFMCDCAREAVNKTKKTESLKLGKRATKGLSEEKGQNMDSVGLVKAQSNAHLFTSTFHADVDTALSVGLWVSCLHSNHPSFQFSFTPGCIL